MDRIDDLIERDRGILTEHDRQYLLGELDEELNDNAEYQKRHQIRNRIRNAIYDFQIITGELEPRDIDQLFEPADEWAVKARHLNEQGRQSSFPKFPLFVECWSAMIQFFVYSQISSNIKESRLLARWVIERGVSRTLRQYGFDYTNEYYETDVSLHWGIERRIRLLNYLQYIENELLANPVNFEDRLFQLYRENRLPYSLTILLHEKHIENIDS